MLDIKYRPARIQDVLGNSGVKKLLLARSRGSTLSQQSMMFGGPKGCGKTTLARIVARAIKCSDLQDGEPCGACSACVSIRDETNQGVEELDAASQGTVDKVRDMVRDADYGSLDGDDLQIYILDEAQRLSKAAQDALLKSVESRLFVVILCTTEPHKIQGPIRDRVEEYPIQAPTPAELEERLRQVCDLESIEAESEALSLIVKMSGTTPRSSLLAMEAISKIGPVSLDLVKDHYRFGSYELIDKILCSIDSDPRAAFSHLDRLFCLESPTWVRDAIVLAVASGLRADVGAKLTFPVPIRFFQARLRAWSGLAMELGAVDRPTYADIEAALLASPGSDRRGLLSLPAPVSSQVLGVPPPAPAVPLPSSVVPPLSPGSPPVAPKLEPAPQVRKERAIEVDGVKFTESESLTSLDGKVRSAPGSGLPTEENPGVQVRLDNNHAPISEKEFASSFRSFRGR